jgi:hypothetical protein
MFDSIPSYGAPKWPSGTFGLSLRSRTNCWDSFSVEWGVMSCKGFGRRRSSTVSTYHPGWRDRVKPRESNITGHPSGVPAVVSGWECIIGTALRALSDWHVQFVPVTPSGGRREQTGVNILFWTSVVWDFRFSRRRVWRTVFWDVPCSLVETDRRFRGAYCLDHQDDRLTHRPDDRYSKL